MPARDDGPFGQEGCDGDSPVRGVWPGQAADQIDKLVVDI
jgi:hypothetical protein